MIGCKKAQKPSLIIRNQKAEGSNPSISSKKNPPFHHRFEGFLTRYISDNIKLIK